MLRIKAILQNYIFNGIFNKRIVHGEKNIYYLVNCDDEFTISLILVTFDF